jgi:hypothetical protein
MSKSYCIRISCLVLPCFLTAGLQAATSLAITITPSPAPGHEGFKMGESRRPDGSTVTLDTCSLRLNGQPWTPVMGEFHYSRYPANEWREELLKMKAGGVDIVATYVFWIHHEEIEGQWDWSGCRDLRRFITTAGEAGLKAIVRCGPWCHGEVRNGGQPDWLLQTGWRLRSDDTNYLAKVRILYQQIGGQLSGLLWKDGGPVIGVQFENEYSGPAQHLLSLKQIGREAGLDVPLYTRTGWPGLSTPMPFGEIAPLYGVYAEGFWDREPRPMPGQYWAGFHFSKMRSDANIANEVLGRNAQDAPDAARYPYLTCEIGGGMMSSYHRRILVYPADIDSTTLVKIGSGSTSPGYYMYHGGVNPEGKLTTLMESQATGMWNDLPVKNYDFQTALGQYGQVRPQYHGLRRLHLFLHEWGPQLAGMSVNLPQQRPAGRDDVNTLRWAVRSDGQSGFVFVNNYERLKQLPAKEGVQFAIKLPTASVTFPHEPVTVPADSRFVWPFNLDLGKGVRLAWATTQPVTAIDDGDTRTVFFVETPGVPAEFAFAADAAADVSRLVSSGAFKLLRSVKPGRFAAAELKARSGGTIRLVLLNETDSLALWKDSWKGRDRVFLSEADLVMDGDQLRLTSTDPTRLNVGVLPRPAGVASGSRPVSGRADGVFTRFTPLAPKPVSFHATVDQVRAAGPPREIPRGKIRDGVAAAPEDADFDQAAAWRIKLPAHVDLGTDPILRLHYVGDVVRVRLDGKLITDDFYNGSALDIGLRRHAPEILAGDLRVEILPLRKDAPIYLASEARPMFNETGTALELRQVEIVPRYQNQLTAK